MQELMAVAVFVAAYVLIATDWVDRVVVALAGAGLVLGLRILDVEDAFHSEKYGVDWACSDCCSA